VQIGVGTFGGGNRKGVGVFSPEHKKKGSLISPHKKRERKTLECQKKGKDLITLPMIGHTKAPGRV